MAQRERNVETALAAQVSAVVETAQAIASTLSDRSQPLTAGNPPLPLVSAADMRWRLPHVNVVRHWEEHLRTTLGLGAPEGDEDVAMAALREWQALTPDTDAFRILGDTLRDIATRGFDASHAQRLDNVIDDPPPDFPYRGMWSARGYELASSVRSAMSTVLDTPEQPMRQTSRRSAAAFLAEHPELSNEAVHAMELRRDSALFKHHSVRLVQSLAWLGRALDPRSGARELGDAVISAESEAFSVVGWSRSTRILQSGAVPEPVVVHRIAASVGRGAAERLEDTLSRTDAEASKSSLSGVDR